jgi:hypothetical protein
VNACQVKTATANSSATLAHAAAAASLTYTPINGLNQLAGLSGTQMAVFTYDSNGFLTSDGTRGYTCDSEGAGRIRTASGGTCGTNDCV